MKVVCVIKPPLCVIEIIIIILYNNILSIRLRYLCATI